MLDLGLPTSACVQSLTARPVPCVVSYTAQNRVSLRTFRLHAASQPPSGGEDDESGDPKLQDTLEKMIRLEIGKKKVTICFVVYATMQMLVSFENTKSLAFHSCDGVVPSIKEYRYMSNVQQQVEEFVEEEGDKLKQKAEEAKEEMERLADLAAMRADLAFDSALADINKEAAEFEEELRKSREELQASEQDFDQWEQDVAANRSEGQFFQSLYQKDKKRPAAYTSEQLQERAKKIVQPAKEEIGSPIRMYLFAFLTSILLADVVADLMTESPAAGKDVLYTGLAFLAGWLAYNERLHLK